MQWTAIVAGAYWMVWSRLRMEGTLGARDSIINFNVLLDIRFLRIAVVPVLVHMFWNSSLCAGFPELKILICGVVSWAVVLRLVAAGLGQVRAAKALI